MLPEFYFFCQTYDFTSLNDENIYLREMKYQIRLSTRKTPLKSLEIYEITDPDNWENIKHGKGYEQTSTKSTLRRKVFNDLTYYLLE